MRNELDKLEESSSVLMDIREGMPVYDVNSEKLGTVQYVQFAVNMANDDLVLNDSDVQHAPEPVRHRLFQHGFIRIGTGLLRKDYFATMEQIESVFNRRVYLNLLRDELISL